MSPPSVRDQFWTPDDAAEVALRFLAFLPDAEVGIEVDQ